MKGTLIRKAPHAMVQIVKGVPSFCRRNSNWLLSALAFLGITGLTWSTIRGTIKAVKLCEEKQVQGAKEVIKTTWKLYLPTIGFFILTTTAIAGNAHINAKRVATLTGLYAASQADIDAMRKKITKVVGPKKAKEVEAEANKERLANTPAPKEDDIAKTGHGSQLFRDWLTGQYFRASPEYVELVQRDMNDSIKGSINNVLMRGYMQEKFHERDCGTKDLFWDLCEMQVDGTKEIELDVSYTEWVEINGQRETCAVLKCIPEATGF